MLSWPVESGPKGYLVPASDGHRAVFLSYASEDTEAAARISGSLRNAGIEVWFDQNEMRGGAAWDSDIKKKIRTCLFFIPIIYANSRARVGGYCRFNLEIAGHRYSMIAAEN